MADQNRRRGDVRSQVIGRSNKIVDVRRECGVGEFAFAAA